MIRIKGFAGLQHAVGDVNELAHGGADNLHFGLAALGQALTENPDDRVVLAGDNGRQKQRFADSGVTGL